METHSSSPKTPQSALSTPYEEALSFWYSHVNFEQKQPAASDLKLDRMRALLSLLDDPHKRLRIVHVAGSKGKGSTSVMFATILEKAGYRTGLFTSPHLERVEERIQVNRQPISSSELAELLTEIRDRVREPDNSGTSNLRSSRQSLEGLTFFEIATALGFLHFVRRRVEAAVIEVGLGGRFDSTNVCLPVLSIITSISLDHTRQLGNRLASIAMEKAGIIKPGRPLVISVTAPEARPVIEAIARERHAPIQQLGIDFHYECVPARVSNDTFAPIPASIQATTAQRHWPAMPLGLLGDHQGANAAGVIAGIEELQKQGWQVSDQAVREGLAGVQWPARMEILGCRPLVVLDCAHNVSSAEALVDTLEASISPGKRFLIFAGSSDKDIPGMFRVLAPYFQRLFLTRYHNNPRAVSPEQLAEWLKGCSTTPFTLCSSSQEAWRLARETAKPEDLICITGSVFLAGEMRSWLVNQLNSVKRE